MSWSYPQRGEWQGESFNPDRLHRSFLPPPVCNHLLTLHYPGFICSSMNEKVMFKFPQTKTVTVTKTMTMAENPVYHNNYHLHWPLTSSPPSGIEWKRHNVLLCDHHLCRVGYGPNYSCLNIPGLLSLHCTVMDGKVTPAAETKDMKFSGPLKSVFPPL